MAWVGKLQGNFPRLTERARLLTPRARERRQRLQAQSRAEVFETIYHSNEWADPESRSGSGSSMVATESFRHGFEAALKEYDVKSLVDVPCGDFNWMNAVDIGDVDYTGIDIVPDLIGELQHTFGQTNRRFRVADVVEEDGPEADAVLCRDLLLHLPLADAEKVIRRLTASYRVCMISTNPGVRRNAEIVAGETRQLNLTLPPFGLPEPAAILSDPSPRFPLRVVGVWVAEEDEAGT